MAMQEIEEPRSTGRRSRAGLRAQPWVVALALAAVCLGVAGLLELAGISSVEYTLGIGTIVVALAPLVRRAATRSFDVFEPIVFAALVLVLTFGARPMLTAAGGIDRFYGFFVAPQLPEAVLLGFLGTSALVVGYELVSSRARPATDSGGGPRLEDLDRRRVHRIALAASVLGCLLFLLHLSLGGSPLATLRTLLAGRSASTQATALRSSEYLSAAPILISCAGILVVLSGRGRLSWRRLGLVIALISLPMLIFLVGGGARRFIIPTLAIPVVVHYLAARRRPSLKKIAVAVPIALLFLAVVPLVRNQGARQNNRGVTGLLSVYAEQPAAIALSVLFGPDTEGYSALAVELGAFDKPSDFFYGRATVGDILLAPIPHAVFPAKPTTARDGILIEAFGSPCRPATVACRNVSVIGTFYADAWYLGVVLGMLALGAGVAAFWRRAVERPERAVALVLGAAATVFLPIMIRASFMPPFAWFLYFVVPTLAGVYLAAGTASPRRALGRLRAARAGMGLGRRAGTRD